MDKHLNIVAFDNPYPPIYGGVIDVYYKIEALAKLGLKIHLHYYSNEKIIPSEIESICEEVFIYKRNKGPIHQLSVYPFIVRSRNSNELIKNLSGNNYPILFEGLHTTNPILKSDAIRKRSIIRHHNIEHDYYLGLYKSEKNILHRLYFLMESFKLKLYLKKIKAAAFHLTISDTDAQKLSSLKFDNIVTIPPFHSFEADKAEEINKPEEAYVLYHGNLNIAENLAAVAYLIEHIFTDENVKYIIAGSNKNISLKGKTKRNLKIIENPSRTEINDIITKASVIVLPTFQATGIKLKLIDSLYMGQHVIVNEAMVKGFLLPELTVVAKNPEQMKIMIKQKLNTQFTSEEKKSRIHKLNMHFDNNKNAERIIELITKLSR